MEQEIVNEVIRFVPYQLCPKCLGQGIVSRPPYIAADIPSWSSTQMSYQCDVCNGSKIIPQCVLNSEPTT